MLADPAGVPATRQAHRGGQPSHAEHPSGIDDAPPIRPGGAAARAGVLPDMIRMSVGLEHIDNPLEYR
jgi:cystathionine beta-lyase/cystathionine gamma-synthase